MALVLLWPNEPGELSQWQLTATMTAPITVTPESSSGVLVVISSKSVSICDRFYVNSLTVAKITHFEKLRSLRFPYRRLLELKGGNLNC